MAKKHKKKKNRLSLIIMLILFVAAGVIVYFVWDSYFKDKEKDEDFQKPESVQVEEKQELEEEKLESENPTKPKVVQYDGDDPNTAEVLTGAVTYAGVNSGKLMIRVNIDQYLESGVCTLDLVRNGNIIYESVANVVGNVTTGTCEGFDVNTEGLGKGETEIVIKVTSGEKSGTIRSGITI